MKEQKPYYVGLDIGTDTVGWAVTDESYNLCRYKGKDMWGIRLFEAANPAATRRSNRANRRRINRKQQRIDLLQMLFASEIEKVDPTFFLRLNESRLHLEDKSTEFKHPLFNDTCFTDIEYYEQYPTIYHLRRELITNASKHDIRLIYLALHHIIKNRGHFLIDGNVDTATDFYTVLNVLLNMLSDELGITVEIKEGHNFEEILRNRNIPKSEKRKALFDLFELNEDDRTKEELKSEKDKITEVLKFVLGLKGDLRKLVDGIESMDNPSFKFSDNSFENARAELDRNMPEVGHIIDCIKSIYDWSILVDILDNEQYLSFAKVKEYEKHKKNLYDLRGLMLKYCSDKLYKEFFNDPNNEKGYTAYIGYVKKNGKKYKKAKKKASTEEFYKELGKILDTMPVEDSDKETYEAIKAQVLTQSLLPILRSKDNGVIPKQVHEAELKRILENASKYYQFLNQEDNGKTVSDKIIDIFNYRIPYYVGPLSLRHSSLGSNSWMVRKEEGYIYPWNFDDKVDLEKSNVHFIERMTCKCTYVLGADVLPKNSILYSKYMVLNELNNLKVRGKKVSVKHKQEVYNNVFLKRSKVTAKDVLNYLKLSDSEIKMEDLSGFSDDFKANLSSYLDFRNKVFGEKMSEVKYNKIAEDIIRWITIYGDDRKMLQNVIANTYPEVTAEEIKAIKKLRYSGWGNFSKIFLTDFESVNPETGEFLNIIDALWETNENLMQLLSKKYAYKENIDNYNKGIRGEIEEISYDYLVKDLYVSPRNKRAIWQTILITEEIKKAMGYEPTKIFVEMARGEDKEKKRTISRKQRLLDLYKSCEGDAREWTREIDERDEREFNSIKLYLYYTQKGRCMYSGDEIDLDELMVANSKWDRDHIYPQSKIKDDSLDNLVLVNKAINSKKDNELLSIEIQRKMRGFWDELYKGGFISKKKYDRLTRKDDFNDDELAGFINRQLVETRQNSREIVGIFNSIYSSKIIPVKARLVSEFRKNELKCLKSRKINDYHHAKDAYLNIVVGNVYDARFTLNPLEWIRKNKDTNYSINKVFWFDVTNGDKIIWKAPDKNGKKLITNEDGGAIGGSIDTVRKVMKSNHILYTEYTYCKKGELFNASHARKTGNSNIPLKKGLDVSKYGGYLSPNPACFVYIEGLIKGKTERKLIGIPIYVKNMQEHNDDAISEYLASNMGITDVKVIIPEIKINSLVSVDGFPLRLRGFDGRGNFEMKPNVQLVLDSKNEETVRLIEKYLEKKGEYEIDSKFDGITQEKLNTLYDVLLDKLENSIYSKRPSNEIELVQSARNCFIELEMKDKVLILNNLIDLFGCSKSTVDLRGLFYEVIGNEGNVAIIGGKNDSGRIRRIIPRGSQIKLINQSVTGIWSTFETIVL